MAYPNLNLPRLHKQGKGWGSIVRVDYRNEEIAGVEYPTKTEHHFVRWDNPTHPGSWEVIGDNDTIENFIALAQLWRAHNAPKGTR